VRWYFPDSEYDHGIVSWRLLHPPFYWAAFIWAFCYWALTNHTLVHGPVHSPLSTRLQEGEVLLIEITWRLLCLGVVLCCLLVVDSYPLLACHFVLLFVVGIS
jgi:hypothetical protein